nr:hypothetical protein [Pedobacter sp.]
MSTIFLRKWLTISFFNLLLVAGLGVVLRYKIAFYLPFIDQKFVLHSHSHFAFSGWITQTLMVLLIHYLSLKIGESVFKRYRWLLFANVITAYGMMISFVIQGYAFFSIGFSILSIIVSYFFAVYYWKDLSKTTNTSSVHHLQNKVSHLWFKAALAFGIFSTFGTFCLAYMMATHTVNGSSSLVYIYFFLHFQYNGWFLFAGLGLLMTVLEKINHIAKDLKTVFWLFFPACFPAYFLSVLWVPFGLVIDFLVIAAVIAQLFGWAILVKVFIKNKFFLSQQFSKYGKVLLILSAIAFTIKLVLQSGSVHPQLSTLSYGFRPIVIGYLHLVLLAVTSVFIIGYIIALKLVVLNITLITGVLIFVVGVFINEILLMIQGIAGLTYNSIPHINIL